MPTTERDNSQEGSVASREQEFSQLTSVAAGRYRVDYRDGEQCQTSLTGGNFCSSPAATWQWKHSTDCVSAHIFDNSDWCSLKLELSAIHSNRTVDINLFCRLKPSSAACAESNKQLKWLICWLGLLRRHDTQALLQDRLILIHWDWSAFSSGVAHDSHSSFSEEKDADVGDCSVCPLYSGTILHSVVTLLLCSFFASSLSLFVLLVYWISSQCDSRDLLKVSHF